MPFGQMKAWYRVTQETIYGPKSRNRALGLQTPNWDENSVFLMHMASVPNIGSASALLAPVLSFTYLDTLAQGCHGHQVTLWTNTISRRLALSRPFRMARPRYSVFEIGPSRFSLPSSPQYALLQPYSSRTIVPSITLF
jgi:hypothetical protein